MQPTSRASLPGSQEIVTVNPLYALKEKKEKKSRHARAHSVTPIAQVTETVFKMAVTDKTPENPPDPLTLPKQLISPLPSPSSASLSSSEQSPNSTSSLPPKSIHTGSNDSLSSLGTANSSESDLSSPTKRTRSKSISGGAFRLRDVLMHKKASGSSIKDDSALSKPDRIVLEAPLLKLVHDSLEGNEKALSVDFLRTLNPLSRAKLGKWFEQNGHKNVLASHAATVRIHQVQEENKKAHLIKSILSADERVMDAFCLASYMIISPVELFTLINQELQGTNLIADEKQSLTLFSIRWIHENAGTSCFLEEPQPAIFATLVKTCQSHALSQIRERAPQLSKFLEGAKKAKPSALFFSQYELENCSTKRFSDIVAKIVSLPPNDPSWHIECTFIAQDLMNYHIQMYLSLRASDFAKKKWPQAPLSISRFVQFQNALSFFIADTILAQATQEKLTQAIRFFLFLSRYTFQNRDFSSTMAINSGLHLAPIARLKTIWEEVKKSPDDKAQLELLNTYFGFEKDYNYQSLRLWSQGQGLLEKFLPFLAIAQKDLELLTEKQRTIQDQNGEPKYNIENMCKVRETIVNMLAHQGSYRREKTNEKPYCDLIACSLASQNITQKERDEKENDRYVKSQQHQPRKQNDS